MAKGKKGAARTPHVHIDKFSKKPDDDDIRKQMEWLKKRGVVKPVIKSRRKN